MFRHVPNLLTTGRLVLAVVFFAMLSWYQYEGRGDPMFLNIAFLIYLVALVTDFLDGYLARKWQVEGAFGRVVDPFVDKILVLGSFVFFAGKNFVIPDPSIGQSAVLVVQTITGVTPAMVVLLLGRELLVTSFRGLAESRGQKFGAEFSGKLKMVVQSVTILVILVYVNYRAFLGAYHDAAVIFRDICIWTTLIVTVWSGLTYLQSGIRAARGGGPQMNADEHG
jgi:CDP-diacylglycerol---glycerol-3-phosphate 3-phosphatidyltransferase